MSHPVHIDILADGGCAINKVIYPTTDPVSMIVRTAFGPYIAEFARQHGVPARDYPHSWTITEYNANTGTVSLTGMEEKP